jgi:hypothetical protein
MAEAMKPTEFHPGRLREIRRTVNGHIRVDWVGEPRTWMNMFAGPVQLKAVGSFNAGNLA